LDQNKLSVWQAVGASRWVERAEVSPPKQVDVVVVGAGMAGLCTASLCLDAGASVAVIEAGAVGGRTTGHSTAKLTALHGLTYAALARGKGDEAAARYAAANVEALIRLRGLIEQFEIGCDLRDATAYTCSSTAEGVRAIEDEAAAARAAGLPVEVVSTTELSLPVTRAVSLAGQAHFDPLAFCRGLADRLTDRGATVVEHARVNEVEEGKDGCVVRGDSFEIHCDVAVIATHLPIVDPALLAARVRPERSYVVAGPAGASAVEGMYISHDGGWSIRSWSGPDGSMLLVGGEGHSMTDHVEGSAHYSKLEEFARERAGIDVHHRWSAFDYVTTDGVPFIGRLAPGSKRRFTATGFRKWGMTTSMVSAMIISDLIAGRENPYLQTFDATRVLPTVTRDLVHNTAKVAVRFVGDRISARRAEDPPDADDALEPGQGHVVRRDGATLAIARDRSGQLHSQSAMCTHLGCVVAFNEAEQTWDCPCHGSRFEVDGTVLDGPASAPLSGAPAGGGES
jgi:glycine/D-amino acid oxidase-like deaminating enzyme/nitrite reductase/ring-hydroxylating ferredoxin subunit